MTEEIIKVDSLIKKFDKIYAVNNISFSVKKGSIFAFLGPNGAGKSTTIKILTTLLKPTSGKISVAGYNPYEEPDKVRKNIGIIFQDQSLDDELTAYENMEFHAILYNVKKEIRKERIKFLLEIVQLWERKNDLVKTFSGGMKRRLEIARGLLHHPKILFLDEPTLGLDPQTRNLIWSHIKYLNKSENITIFLTTHYMEEAERIADNIAIIDCGKIIAEGTSDYLKKITAKKSLEDAFIKLTGHNIREQESNAIDNMRLRKRLFGR